MNNVIRITQDTGKREISQIIPVEKEKNKCSCPYCNYSVELIHVHGHFQCPVCKNVVLSCCGDR